MFNITDQRARAIYQRRLTIIMIRLEHTQARSLRGSLNSQFLNAARAVEQGIDDIAYIIDAQKTKMIEKFRAHLQRTGNIFSKMTFKEIPEKSMQDEFWLGYNAWMTTQAAKKIRQVSDTTKKVIAKIIKEAADEQLTRKEIAKAIRKKGGMLNPVRAITIAKTETHTAAVKAIDDSVQTTRIDFQRDWIATMDERTREDHSAADGQVRGMKDEFNVGGEGLMFPGDPMGSAENVINCRCVLGYLSA